MKKVVVVIVLFSLAVDSVCTQEAAQLPKNSIQVFSRFSKSGTENVGGFAFSVGYNHFFSKRFSWSASASTTFHDGSLPMEYLTYSGLQTGSVYFTSAGFQTEFI